MQYHSTRDSSRQVSAAQAIARGLAPDGGLFVPDVLPRLELEELKALADLDYPSRAAAIMGKFLEDFSQQELRTFAAMAYGSNFDDPAIAPVRFLDDETAVLELWHGPTCAFKDMALQMLPHLLTASLVKTGEARKVCILVATSGDTGKAALEGFRDVPGTGIVVFYPRDGVSHMQKLQMVTQEGKNVCVSAVAGNFDDAQSGVKAIFGDRAFADALSQKGWFLSSANSINWGRLLPQIVYYISAYCDCVNAGRLNLGEELDFCVPTGNFGNILAGWYAKEMGLPAGRFLCASNANNVLTEFLETGVYDRNRPFHTTISPSMDILVSSNLERLLHAQCGDKATSGYMSDLSRTGRYALDDAAFTAIRRDFYGGCCDDAATRDEIRRVFSAHNYLVDPHTAVASHVLCRYRDKEGCRPTVLVSTASPFKFAADVLSALGRPQAQEPLAALASASGMPVPAPLAGLETRPVRFAGCVEADGLRDLISGFLA